jgi:hypothetical protein
LLRTFRLPDMFVGPRPLQADWLADGSR